ncbi:MAG: hypothetical protein IZT59_03455 [Verrucomicrobia bacterium]|nr:hypothetical protein [Verrucomicrobiota bacterium]
MMSRTQLGRNRQSDYSRHYHHKVSSVTQVSGKCRRSLEREKIAKRKKWMQAGAVLLTLLSAGFIIATLIYAIA